MSQAEADTQKQLILTTNAKLFISVFYNVFQVLNSSNTKMSSSESSSKYKYEVWLALRNLALDNMIYKCLLSKKYVQMQFFFIAWYIFIELSSEGMSQFPVLGDWYMRTSFLFFSWISVVLKLSVPRCQMSLQAFLKEKVVQIYGWNRYWLLFATRAAPSPSSPLN